MRILKSHKTDPVEHLLVVRLTDLGRTAMVVLAVGELRATHPELHITVATDAQYVPLFAKIKNIDFIAFSKGDLYRGVVGHLRLVRDLKRLRVDGIADLEGSSRSWRMLLGVRHRCRHASIESGRRQKELMTRKFRKVLIQHPSTLQRATDTFNKLGFEVSMPAFVRRAPRNKQSSLLTNLAGKKEGPWVGIAPFSKHKGKCYPLPQTDRLVELLLKSCRRVFILGEGRYEQQFGEGVERRRRGVVSLVGRCTLPEELEALSVLDAVVTVDNPVLHLCSLAGTPVVSLWGATHPYLDSCGYGQRPDSALGLDMPCRPCSASGQTACLFGHYGCMLGITPESIAGKVEKLL